MYSTDKFTDMKSTYNIIGTVAVVLFLAACGASSGKDGLAEKKAKLEDLKKQEGKLEEEIAKLDTSAAKAEKPKLVVLSTIQSAPFTHYIDLQGNVDTYYQEWVTPRGQGGQIVALYVKQGDNVRKGQLLMKLDDAIIRQQIEQANVQLNLANTTYDRRKNLWDQKIGTEMELINAKSNVDNIIKQIDLLKEQQGMTNVYAPMSGTAEKVDVRVGSMFSPATATMGGISIINTADLKITTQVPEAYQTKVKEGTNLVVTLPEDNNKTINARVSVAGKTISPTTRSFYIEAKIPGNIGLRPGQIAMVRIQDYAVPKAITIPVNTLQNDDKGKFVMLAVTENGKKVARKKAITVGALYGDKLEVTNGLQAGDVVISDGFQGLYDGQAIVTDAK